MNVRSHSSDVDLVLVVEEQQIELSHVGSVSVIVRGVAQAVPPRHAQLVIKVDGISSTNEIYLQEGIPASESPEVKYLLSSGRREQFFNAPGFWR